MIAVNGYDETKEVIQKFVNEKKLKQPILKATDLDGDGKEDVTGSKIAYDLFAVQGFPSSFWIDARGRLISRKVGFDPSRVPAMEKRIEKLLAETREEAKPK